VITAGTRKDSVASATARRASRKASNPPGCTILFSVAVNATSNLIYQHARYGNNKKNKRHCHPSK
ncbi:hypothetical protein MJI20_32125, partial [Salmonella enterica subsp. enterica serovar Anatum]|nr:hypothetical protein [Salmonella enterica subsp. enterica serovar Anatum]